MNNVTQDVRRLQKPSAMLFKMVIKHVTVKLIIKMTWEGLPSLTGVSAGAGFYLQFKSHDVPSVDETGL